MPTSTAVDVQSSSYELNPSRVSYELRCFVHSDLYRAVRLLMDRVYTDPFTEHSQPMRVWTARTRVLCHNGPFW